MLSLVVQETNMEAPEELSLGSKDHANIIKGKRTKRVGPQSPIPFSITANSSTGEEGGRGDCYVNGDKDDDTNNNNNNNNNNNTSHTPTTSPAEFLDSTEEEEDMANCLILLAQGQSRKQSDEDGGMNYTRYSSRKFMEAADLGSGKAGYYVYECKTCSRTFPSFQALGGHRASHKKPKALVSAAIDQDKKRALLLSSDEEEFQLQNNNRNNPLSLQLTSRGNLYSYKMPKVHECSICGAEFTSGQALGGHMRRHRAPIGTNTALSLTPTALEQDENQPRKRRNVMSLDLDLNLPAPEDDQRESKFAFASKQQQQQEQQQQANLVFSAPTLVDCHY